jgi:uncharacterized repeat protein (TIGR01451 family)
VPVTLPRAATTMVALVGALAAPGPAQAQLPAIAVHAATGSVTAAQASETPVSAACPAGEVLVGGGIRAFYSGPPPQTGDYRPINGLIMRGTTPTSGGLPVSDGATDPAQWTAFGGFAGQFETDDSATAFAMCSTADGPRHTVVATRSVGAPTVPSTTAAVTATCPPSTRLVGGGARMTPASSASAKPVGSYPSDATGSLAASSDPDSWTAVGESGGQMNLMNVTTAFALCSTDPSLHTTVVRADVIDHPAGPGNATTPGADPIANATATCPFGTQLLAGGELAIGSAEGDDRGNLQQGVHARGSYPSDAAGGPVTDGATAPGSWTAIVQSGGTPTPGTDTFAFALCARPAIAGDVADLSVSNADAPDPVTAGDELTYTVQASNAGPQAATGVTLTDELPGDAVTFVSASSTAGACGHAAGTVTCPIGALAAGATATATIVVDTIAAGVLSATASVTGEQGDPVMAGNSATATTTVALPVKATPALTGAASASVPAGAAIHDAATLAGGHDASGTIAFDVYGPGDTACATSLAGSTAAVAGDATYESAPFTARTAGTYRWIARYGGDVNNEPAGPTACAGAAQAVAVTKASPALSAQASPSTVTGAAIGAVAVFEGGSQPTGTLTFRVFGPDDASCAAPLATSTMAVSAAGAYGSQAFAPPGPGAYRWTAAYSGDANNDAAGPGPCAGAAASIVAAALPDLPPVTAYAFRSALSIGSATSTAVVARCPAGSVLTGGGALVARAGGGLATNSLKLNGSLPGTGDPAGDPPSAAPPSSWAAVAAFGGQGEAGDEATAFALCAGAPPGRHIVVASATSAGDVAATSTTGVTATCPPGTRLVGGGALATPASAPNLRPVAGFPGDALGRASLADARDPASWTAIAAAQGITAGAVTRAFALCSDDPELHTTVARVDALGPQTRSASAAVTTTCRAGTRLLSGGVRLDASGSAPAQGVHVRGSYPSDSDGVPVGAGASGPGSWTAVAQAGPQDSPGTNQRVFALCAIASVPPTSPPPAATPPPPPLAPPPVAPPLAPPGAPPPPAGPTSARIASSLRRQIVPAARYARVSTLLSKKGIPLTFTPLAPGRVVISWYRPAATKKGKPVLVARGSATFKVVRKATIRMHAQRAGRRLLKRPGRAHLTAKGTFAPAGGRAVTASRTLVLRH